MIVESKAKLAAASGGSARSRQIYQTVLCHNVPFNIQTTYGIRANHPYRRQ